MKWIENTEKFRTFALEGWTEASFVRQMFVDAGCQAVQPPFEFRDSIADIERFTREETDLFVNGFPIEVKSINDNFTDFMECKYDPVMVDTVSGFEAKIVKPLAYVMICPESRGTFTVPVKTHPRWTTGGRVDGERGIYDTFYLCRKQHLQPFDVLVDYIKRHSAVAA